MPTDESFNRGITEGDTFKKWAIHPVSSQGAFRKKNERGMLGVLQITSCMVKWLLIRKAAVFPNHHHVISLVLSCLVLSCSCLVQRVLNLNDGHCINPRTVFWGPFGPRSTKTRYIFVIGQAYLR